MRKTKLDLRRSLARYLARTRRYSAPRFLLEMLALSFGLSFLWGALFQAFGVTLEAKTTEVIAAEEPFVLFFLAIILAPTLETLIGQWLPIAFIRLFTKKLGWIIGGSALFFAAQHLHVGWMGFVTVFPTAVVLSWSWVAQRRFTRRRAYWMTTTLHALHNAVALAFYFSLVSP